MWSGWLRGSIYWVLLIWGRFCVTKTIIPAAQEHFLPLQHAATFIFSVDWGLVPGFTFVSDESAFW